MAQLKDLMVTGPSRLIGEVTLTQLSVPTASNGTTLGLGTDGQVLATNSSSVYWLTLGTAAAKAITDKSAATAIGNSDTNLITARAVYYGLPTINNAHNYTSSTTIYAPTAGGTQNTQALVGNGATTAPKWVNISPSISITAGSGTDAPKVNVTVLGQSGTTAQSITKASIGVYGVTKLSSDSSSTEEGLAATPKGVSVAVSAAISTAIEALDSSLPSGSAASKTLTALSIVDGKMNTATFSSIAIAASQVTSGTLTVARGGTGQASWTPWGVVYASDSTTLTQITAGATTNKYQVLQSQGAAAPAWAAVWNLSDAGVLLANNTDANSLAYGVSHVANSTAMKTIANNPAGNNAGSGGTFYTMHGYVADYDRQFLYDTSNGIKFRRKNQGTWQSWRVQAHIPYGAAVGSETTPTYVEADGEIKACTTSTSSGTASRLAYYTDSSTIASSAVAASGSASLYPITTKSFTLGTSNYYWDGAYINGNGSIHWNNLAWVTGDDIIATSTERGIPRMTSGNDLNIVEPGSRLWGMSPASVTIEYTTDNGVAWTTANVTDRQKRGLTNGEGLGGNSSSNIGVGGLSGDVGDGNTQTIAVGLGQRITIDLSKENRKGAYIYCFDVYFIGRDLKFNFLLERYNKNSGTWTSIYSLNDTALGTVHRVIYPKVAPEMYGTTSSATTRRCNQIRLTLIISSIPEDVSTSSRYAPYISKIGAWGSAGLIHNRTSTYPSGRLFDITMAQYGQPYYLSDRNSGNITVPASQVTIYGVGGYNAAGTDVYATLVLGNSGSRGATGAHSEGRILLYSASTAAHVIRGTSTGSERNHYFPDADGWIATGGNGTSTGAGDTTHPVFLSTAGVLTQCSGTLPYNISGTAGAVAWANITGAPSSFTPSSHTHGSITNDGKLGTATRAVVTDSNKNITVADLSVNTVTAETASATTFVHSVTQNTQGKITVKTRPFPTQWTSAIRSNDVWLMAQDNSGLEGGQLNFEKPSTQTLDGMIDLYSSDNTNTFMRIGTPSDITMWLNITNHTIQATGDFYASRVYNAVWNDYAEYRKSKEEEPGRVVVDTSHKIMERSTARLQPGAHIISDTYGNSVGMSDEAKTPIGIAGRVLAYTYQDRNNYHIGDAVCAAPNGTIDIMTREEIIQYPDRIIGIVSEIPDYEIWDNTYTNEYNKYPVHTNIKVNGRIWVYVR